MYRNAYITVILCYIYSYILQQNGLAQRFPSPKVILSTRHFQHQNGITRRFPSPLGTFATRHLAIRVIANMTYKIHFTENQMNTYRTLMKFLLILYTLVGVTRNCLLTYILSNNHILFYYH